MKKNKWFYTAFNNIMLTKCFSDLEELDPPLNPLRGGDLAL